jgi:hypothetical protein
VDCAVAHDLVVLGVASPTLVGSEVTSSISDVVDGFVVTEFRIVFVHDRSSL